MMRRTPLRSDRAQPITHADMVSAWLVGCGLQQRSLQGLYADAYLGKRLLEIDNRSFDEAWWFRREFTTDPSAK
jgi:hypothetical protein